MKNIKAIISLLLITAMVLGGCNTQQSETTSIEKNTSGKSENNSQPITDSADKSERVLRLRITGSLTSLDWTKTVNIRDMKVWHQIFEGLYGMDEANNGYYKELADQVDISDDKKTYTITLRSGVTFQNGDLLKASDVVFSYQYAMDNPGLNYLTNPIESVEAVDDSTVRFTLKAPHSPITHTFFSIKIMSEREVKEQGDKFGTIPNMAGTGPYYATEYDIATGVKLKAYDGYWGGSPSIKDVEYIVISDDAAAVIAYENGELDYYEEAPINEWDSLSQAAGESSAMLKGNNILFVEATQYMPSEYVPTSPKDGFKVYDYDPELAKKLLAEAGYPDGVDVGTILTYGASTSRNAKTAQVLQANLADVGITASVSVMEMANVMPKLYAQEYDICIYGDASNYDYDNIRQQVHSESVGLYVVKYKDGPFDWQRLEELVALGASTTNTDERVKYYTELWSIVMDTATILPVLHYPTAIVWASDLDVGAPVPMYYKIRTFKWK